MSTAIITGSAGLIGSEAARHFHGLGWDVFGIDNDLRATFFGAEASTQWMADSLGREGTWRGTGTRRSTFVTRSP